MFKKSLLVAAALALVTTSLHAAPARRKAVRAKPVASQVAVFHAQAAAAMISAYRAQHGLGPVALDPRLSQAAAYQARANAQSGTLSHDVGGSFRQRMAATGGRGYSAENLGAGRMSFDQMFAYWQGSSAHNTNMLVPRFRRVGVAYVDAPGSMYGRFWAMTLAD